MTLWPCASCASTAWCEHREPELIEWAVRLTAEAGEIADPLPPPEVAGAGERVRGNVHPEIASAGERRRPMNSDPASIGNRDLQRIEFDAITNLFTKDFNDALEAIMRDPLETIAVRFRAWYKRKAWGNYSRYCVNSDGTPAFQSDCTTELRIKKQRVNDAAKYDEARGYLELVGPSKLLYPVVSPRLKDPESDSGEKSGTYRTFLQLWLSVHSAEFAELKDAEATCRRIRTLILSEFRDSKKSGYARTFSDAPESGGVTENGPDVPDLPSGNARTKRPVSLQISSDTDTEDTGGRAASVGNSARPPAESITKQLREFLTEKFSEVVGTVPDPRILMKIATHIPDEGALDQFRKATSRAKPEKGWALFASIAAQCEAQRKAKGTTAAMRPKPQSAEERAAEELATYLMDLDNPDLSEAEHETARQKIAAAPAAIAAEARRRYEAMKPRVAGAAE